MGIIWVHIFCRIQVTQNLYFSEVLPFYGFLSTSDKKESYPQKMQIAKESPDVIVFRLLPVNI